MEEKKKQDYKQLFKSLCMPLKSFITKINWLMVAGLLQY